MRERYTERCIDCGRKFYTNYLERDTVCPFCKPMHKEEITDEEIQKGWW